MMIVVLMIMIVALISDSTNALIDTNTQSRLQSRYTARQADHSPSPLCGGVVEDTPLERIHRYRIHR